MSSGSKPIRRGDLLARGLRALEEEVAQELAGRRVAPPVLADRLDQVAAELGRADPGAEVVGRVEAGVHVGEVAACGGSGCRSRR